MKTPIFTVTAAIVSMWVAMQVSAHEPPRSMEFATGCTADGEATVKGVDNQALAAQQRCNEADVQAKFKTLDADRSGALSKTELPAGHDLLVRGIGVSNALFGQSGG